MTETIRVAAAGDIHCAEPLRERIARAFADLQGKADVVLLAGDLTTHGEPEEAAVLADACRPLELPVYAVLGNHDFHANRCDEVIAVLEEAGIQVLQRGYAVHEVGGLELGIVGGKGLRRRLPRRRAARLRRAAPARGLRRDDAGGRGDRGGARAGVGLPPPRRPAPLRPDPGDARRRAGDDLGLPRLLAARRSRSAPTGPTSSCTATRTAAPSRPSSARCRCATSPCTCSARTSSLRALTRSSSVACRRATCS